MQKSCYLTREQRPVAEAQHDEARAERRTRDGRQLRIRRLQVGQELASLHEGERNIGDIEGSNSSRESLSGVVAMGRQQAVQQV